MDNKVDYGAIPSALGFTYQYLVALDKLNKITTNQSVVIETLGDVTVVKEPLILIDNEYIDYIEQLEVKNFSDNLTDTHKNFWNTLKNWLEHYDKSIKYKKLILYTTQEIGKNSKFNDWSNKNKEEKFKILKDIKDKQESRKNSSEETKKLIDKVFQHNNSKIENILEKLEIQDNQKNIDEYYCFLKDNIVKNIIPEHEELYLKYLLGEILTYPINNVKWEFTYDEFKGISRIANTICSKDNPTFPSKYIKENLKDEKIKINDNDKFISKIRDIQKDRQIITAKKDFYRTKLMLLDFFSRSIHNSNVKNYQIKLQEEHCRQYNKQLDALAKMEILEDIVILESQKFYESIMDLPISYLEKYGRNYDEYFQRGNFHILANENDKVVWKLDLEFECESDS